MKKKMVTIGIPAFQSEANIAKLLESLLNQKQKFYKLNEIAVYVDGSTDNTLKNARGVKSRKIKIVNSKKNHGFGFALQFLISKNKSDIFIGLNDDIRIDSNEVIDEMVRSFKNKKVGLVGGSITALKPETFIGRCIYSSYLVYENLRYKIKDGQSDLTCDGKIFALSKAFAKTLNLKKPNVGNVDIYLYYENLKQGGEYRFARKAEVKYRLPETISDFKSQEVRAQTSRKLMQQQFGAMFTEHHRIPRIKLLTSILKVFMKYPIETICYKLLVNSFITQNKKMYSKWKLALSTKKLAVIFSDLGGIETGL